MDVPDRLVPETTIIAGIIGEPVFMATDTGWRALVGMLLLVPGCQEKGTSSDGGLYSAVEDALLQLYNTLCRCEVEAGRSESVVMCLGETGLQFAPDPVSDCVDEVVAASPTLTAAYECILEAYMAAIACESNATCEPEVSFTCDGGTEVPQYWVCNGYPECVDGTDEVGCPPPFVCDGDYSIPSNWICDGYGDCYDGTDELDCPPEETTCAEAFQEANAECPQPTDADDEALADACGIGTYYYSETRRAGSVLASRDPRAAALLTRQRISAASRDSLTNAIRRDVPRRRRQR
jgi:hypothetical protein